MVEVCLDSILSNFPATSSAMLRSASFLISTVGFRPSFVDATEKTSLDLEMIGLLVAVACDSCIQPISPDVVSTTRHHPETSDGSKTTSSACPSSLRVTLAEDSGCSLSDLPSFDKSVAPSRHSARLAESVFDGESFLVVVGGRLDSAAAVGLEAPSLAKPLSCRSAQSTYGDGPRERAGAQASSTH